MSAKHRRAAHRGVSRANGHDRWLLSYADFMTLLFAFFAVMYGVSTVDADKLTPAVASMHEAFATKSVGPVITVAPGNSESVEAVEPVADPVVPVGQLREVGRRLSSELATAIEAGRLEISETARGLVLSLPVEATFAVGSAELADEARSVIGRIGATLHPLANPIRIEGHTDDVPIRTARYASNWELLTARASAVVEFLIVKAQVEPVRLSAAGYGEFHPRSPNDSPVNRARNRRVDIVVLNAEAMRDEPAAEVIR